MADVAQLGVQVTSNGVNETTAGLTKLSGAASRAEATIDSLGSASKAQAIGLLAAASASKNKAAEALAAARADTSQAAAALASARATGTATKEELAAQRAKVNLAQATQAAAKAELDKAAAAQLAARSTLEAAKASEMAALAAQKQGSAAASSSKQVEMMNRAANQNNAALNATIAPSKNVAYQARMMALQLSQVAQQTQAGGDFIRALAIQLPDLATGFGAVGIAIGVVSGIALQYFGTLIGSGEDSAKVLREQQQLITETAQAWGEAVPALQQYVDQLQRAADLKNLDDSLKVLSQQTIANVKTSVDDLRGSFANLTQDLRQAGEEDQVIINLEKAFNDFVKAAQEGKDVTSQVKTVNDALSAAINSTGLPALSEWAASFNGVATAAANAAGQVEKLSNSALTAKLFGGDKLNPLSPLSIYDGKVVSNDQNPQGTVVTDDGRYVPIPTPSDRPSPYGFAEPKTNTAGLKRNADAYRDLVKNAHDRIDQMKLEAQTAGETGIAAETLSFKLKLLQDATDKGRTVTAAQRAEIEKLADAYIGADYRGRYSTLAGGLRLLKRKGFGNHAELAASLFEEIPVAMASVGDIAAIKVDTGGVYALGVVQGPRIYVVRPGEAGIGTVDLLAAERAFRV